MASEEIWCPSVDVCGFCGDSECDGIGCIASLDANNVNDHPAIEELHSLLRAGRIFLQANDVLAYAENRKPLPWAASALPLKEPTGATTAEDEA